MAYVNSEGSIATRIMGKVRRKAYETGEHIRELFLIAADFVAALVSLKGSQLNYMRNLIIHQIIFSGVDAISILSVMSLIIGGVVMVQLMSFSPGFQSNPLLMKVMVSLIITELAPVFSALILVGRSGSAITVELGEMKVKRHHEALEYMGIDIAPYFHVPRIIGLAFSAMMLNGYFVIMTLAAWIAISSFDPNVALWGMLDLLGSSVSLDSIILGAIKGAILGMVVGIVCIHHGMEVKSSATEIPQRASKAIMESFLFCFGLDAVISVVWYMAI
jgi:phospholipid/cholesterol/gamma-HCH transport system permease protein